MLILTRRVGERLIIDDHIEITILELQGSQIKLGIDAPKEISIYRKEIYEKNGNKADQSSMRSQTEYHGFTRG